MVFFPKENAVGDCVCDFYVCCQSRGRMFFLIIVKAQLILFRKTIPFQIENPGEILEGIRFKS